MKGLGGNDTYTVNHTGDKVIEYAGQGNDTVEASVSHTLAANVENLQLTGDASISGTGNELNNSITGNDSDNTLRGGLGNDTLNGWGGEDTMYGDGGNDVFQFTSPHSADGDVVADFSDGDKLDFSRMDANSYSSGTQDWTFDGYRSYGSGSSGHLWAVEDRSAGVTHLYGNTGGYVFQIDLRGTGLGLSTADFTL